MTVTEPTAERTTDVEVDEAPVAGEVPTEDVLVEEVLVEEISIDGMCGVY